MRRALSILLVLLFGFGPLTSTLDAADDARLPACCRRHGAHHCAMSSELMAIIARSAGGRPMWTGPAHCPMYPGLTHALVPPMHALAATETPNLRMAPAPLAAVARRATALVRPVRTGTCRAPPSFLI